MKRQLIASVALAALTLFTAQASFAEESSLMQNRMVQLNEKALQQQKAEQTATHQVDSQQSASSKG
ncbi:MAG: hypothetical protein GAK45_01141 [Pseudomonas citronellolis]|nr:MAG: hypothetical protein GAK45_01141 [Pseudomonas citronellolis]